MRRKSILFAATLILSASIYAMGHSEMNDGRENMGNGRPVNMESAEKCPDFKDKLSKLTEDQKNEIEKVLKKYGVEKKKIIVEMKEKDIVIEKLLIEEKIDWTKVEKALTDASAVHVKMRLIQLKEQKEISTITGEEMFVEMGRREKGPKMMPERF